MIPLRFGLWASWGEWLRDKAGCLYLYGNEADAISAAKLFGGSAEVYSGIEA